MADNTRLKELTSDVKKLADAIIQRDLRDASTTQRLERLEGSLENITRALDSLTRSMDRLSVQPPPPIGASTSDNSSSFQMVSSSQPFQVR